MSNVRSDALDAYNPFESTQQSAILSGGEPSRPNGILSDQARALDEMRKKQAELDTRAAELDRREREHATLGPVNMGTINNWPPFPSCCPCKSCFRVDFDTDFAENTRNMARFGHYLWYSYTAVLLVNLFGTLAYMIADNNSTSNTLFGSSVLILVILPIYAFLGWDRTLYKALKKDSSLSFFAFFLFFAIQIVILVIQSLGIQYLGSCGWINGFATCGVNKGVCAFMLVIASLFTLLVIAALILIFKVHGHFRGSDANLEAAKREAVKDISQSVFTGNNP